MLPACNVFLLGSIPYETARSLQEDIADGVAAGSLPPTLLLLEHPHTYTIGRKSRDENLLWGETTLAEKGIAVFRTDRGGDLTYHGPGQVVGYPIIPINIDGLVFRDETDSLPQADYVGYVRKLEETILLALKNLGVIAFRLPGMTGVWVEYRGVKQKFADKFEGKPAKIASIGVKVDVRGITRHGFALNLAPDMSYWEGIVACGLDGYQTTSLAELLEPIPGIEVVNEQLISAFGYVFGYEMQVFLSNSV